MVESIPFISSDLSSVALKGTIQNPDSLATQDTVRIVPIEKKFIKTPLDVSNLFLEIEQKSIEVEQHKVEQARRVTTRVRKVQQPVDTTCTICPTGEHTKLYKLVESEEIGEAMLIPYHLYDKEYHKNNVSSKHFQFNEATNQQHTTTQKPVDIQPLHIERPMLDWSIYPSLAILIILVYARMFYWKSIPYLFRGGLFYFIASKLASDDTMPWLRFSFFLDVLYFLVVPFGVCLSVEYLEVDVFGFTSIQLFLAIFTLLFAFRLFRYVSHKTVGMVSDRLKDLNVLYFNHLIYTRISALVLAPLVVLMAFANSNLVSILIIISGVFLAIVLFFRFFRTLQVFISKGFSLFYLILYLCALEIIPVLLVAKAI